MACFRIVLLSSLAALALVPANLANASWTAGVHPVELATVQNEMKADAAPVSPVLLGGAIILIIAGRRRRG